EKAAKMITLPVLEDGEIYIRFGKTGTMKVSPESKMHDKPRDMHRMSGFGTPALSPEIMRDVIRSVLYETLRDLGMLNTGGQRILEQRVDTGRFRSTDSAEIDEAAIEKRILERLDRGQTDNDRLLELQKQINDLSDQIRNMSTTSTVQPAVDAQTST